MLKRLIFGIATALALILLISARPVFAHPYVTQTDPPDGASLNEAPGEVRIFLNQSVLLDFTTIELVDGDGHQITPQAVQVETNTSPKTANSSAASLVIKLPALPSNTYRLAWKTRSEDDFHITSGTIVFGVQRPAGDSPAGPGTPVLPSWPEVALRWLSFMAVAGLAGILCLALVVVPQPQANLKAKPSIQVTPTPAKSQASFDGVVLVQNRLLGLARWSGWLALASGAFFLIWQGVVDNFSWERWLELLTATAFGQRWVAGEVILIFLLALLYLAAQKLYARRYKWLVLLLLAVLTGAASQNTHAGLPGSLPWLNFLADSLHLMGAGAWIGGLAGLLWSLRPGPGLALHQPFENSLAWLILRRFSLLAAVSIPVLAVTGLYKSGQQIASLDGLLTTLYGQALLFKFQLALFAALLGLFNALLLHPRLRTLLHLPARTRFFKPHLLRRTLLVEVVALGVVMLAAAFLSAAEPARGPEFQPAVSQPPALSNYSTSLDDLVVNFSVKPNQPGRNFVDLYLFNTRRPIPGPFEEVRLVLRSPEGRETTLNMSSLQVQNDHYQFSGDQIQTGGNWQVEVNVSRPNLPVARSNFEWKVGQILGPTSRRPVVFSNQPVTPWFNLGALAVLLVTMALWVGIRFRAKTFFSNSLTALLIFGSVKRDAD